VAFHLYNSDASRKDTIYTVYMVFMTSLNSIGIYYLFQFPPMSDVPEKAFSYLLKKDDIIE
jgi:hypothetical protein